MTGIPEEINFLNSKRFIPTDFAGQDPQIPMLKSFEDQISKTTLGAVGMGAELGRITLTYTLCIIDD